MSSLKQPESVQQRTHMGHSHSHGHNHNHDNTFLTSTNSKDLGVRITRIGLATNLGMAIAKGTGGVVFHSQALLADALHALTDLVSDILTLATISYSLRSATTRFPFGYGKIESLGALGVSSLLLTGGIMIGIQSTMALSQAFFPELAHVLSNIGIFGHAHSHSHSHGDMVNINAAWLAGGSIIIKEWLYRATMKVAKQKRSGVLASNAYHHRVDSLTALVALVTISASHFLTGAQWLDPVGGLVISGMIVQAGFVNTKSALLELADVGVSDEIKDNVQEAAEATLQESIGSSAQVKGVQGMKSGQNILIEIAVAAPKDWTLSKLNSVEASLRGNVATKVRGVKRVIVRFSDSETAGAAFEDEFVTARSSDAESDDDGHHAHDHSHSNGRSEPSTTKENGSSRKVD